MSPFAEVGEELLHFEAFRGLTNVCFDDGGISVGALVHVVGLLHGTFLGACNRRRGVIDCRGLEGAQFARLHVFFTLRHGQTPVECRECWDKGETDLKSPHAIKFAVIARFQCRAKATKEDECDDGASEGTLRRSVTAH